MKGTDTTCPVGQQDSSRYVTLGVALGSHVKGHIGTSCRTFSLSERLIVTDNVRKSS